MGQNTIDLKVVLLGKKFGGKTSLIERYLHGTFNKDIPYQNTIGAAFAARSVDVNGRLITMGIWDTAGCERYEAMSRFYYREAKAAVICYDLTQLDSFEKAKFWIEELHKNEEDCLIYLCGTKKDLICSKHDRKVDYHMTTDYADEINSIVFETSSMTGESVNELFERIAEDYATKTAKFTIADNSVIYLKKSGDTNSFFKKICKWW